MEKSPIEDIEEWAGSLSPWKQDALRRIAINSDITHSDLNDLLSMVKTSAGFELSQVAPVPEPFTKGHFGGGKHPAIALKGIANVENVNRLKKSASLDFNPQGLTIVYGRNGSGKSGFVRILRTACRTRVENPAKLKILADVYGSSTGPQTADIVIEVGGAETAIPWATGKSALPELMQVSVFDTASAQLYVDGGNQIRFLPFGLALPHRLNNICIRLKEIMDVERTAEVTNKLSVSGVEFPIKRETNSQIFNRSLRAATTDPEIDAVTGFEEGDQHRLDSITSALTAGASAAADVASLVKWVEALGSECNGLEGTFGDSALQSATKLRDNAVSARQAATVAATDLFAKEPLPSVGSAVWQNLWSAARDYSVSEGYKSHEFPVVKLDQGDALCVLCQQPLQAEGIVRMQRFQKYMDDTLDENAKKAENALSNAVAKIQKCPCLHAVDFPDRLEQVNKRDVKLSEQLKALNTSTLTRHAVILKRLAGLSTTAAPVMTVPHSEIDAFLKRIKTDQQTLAQAADEKHRGTLIAEKAELEDKKTLFANKARLIAKRDLLALDEAYSNALADLQTRSITQRANELVDTHLTSAVTTQFDDERGHFDILHLKVGLARKSNQTKAEFEMNTQTKITKVTSDILSEGEQRALALAGFLTEVKLTDGSGPIVIDDPVSSLDRDRSGRVAGRLATESIQRQVIVFTHDMIFLNELCHAAEKVGIEARIIALFSDSSGAGKVDPGGLVWKGLNVAKRLGKIKDEASKLGKLHVTSPSNYEFQVKNLYGRLRDTYEKVVEEFIFNDVVRRGTDVIQTQRLRGVKFSDAMALRFHDGMTLANTYSHDNPAADTVLVPTPTDFNKHVGELEALIHDLKAETAATEAARPQMKAKP